MLTINHSFLKMIAVAKAGGQLITFSDRFGYEGMTGTFDPTVKTGLSGLTGTTGPATQDNTAKPGAAAPVGGDFDMEYTLQTGPTRYAPMQPVPPTKITAKNTQPLYPTSSVVIATTRLPIPKIQTTLTQSQTFTVQSIENTVRYQLWHRPALSLLPLTNALSGRPCTHASGRHAKIPQAMARLE